VHAQQARPAFVAVAPVIGFHVAPKDQRVI
jgi:hypothetical protein